jgi:ATP-dependent DNA helicase RecQ
LPVVSKVRDNQPQKMQQNRYFQCHNLDGVFRIAGGIANDPVLLVDDMVDSAWTLTVVAALLRGAGSGPVWPLALASTCPGD